MEQNFNKLTPAETERLAILMEECAEVIHVCGKILRHGYDSTHPDDQSNTNNRRLLAKELGDLTFAVVLLESNDDISPSVRHNAWSEKSKSIQKYLHHNKV